MERLTTDIRNIWNLLACLLLRSCLQLCYMMLALVSSDLSLDLCFFDVLKEPLCRVKMCRDVCVLKENAVSPILTRNPTYLTLPVRTGP